MIPFPPPSLRMETCRRRMLELKLAAGIICRPLTCQLERYANESIAQSLIQRNEIATLTSQPETNKQVASEIMDA